MDPLARLSGFRFAAQLSDAARDELAAALIATDVDQTKTLVRRGDRVAGAYLVVSGTLRVYAIDGKRREMTLYCVEPGDACIFAMSCAFNDGLGGERRSTDAAGGDPVGALPPAARPGARAAQVHVRRAVVARVRPDEQHRRAGQPGRRAAAGQLPS